MKSKVMIYVELFNNADISPIDLISGALNLVVAKRWQKL
jgi:hypothetical protein